MNRIKSLIRISLPLPTKKYTSHPTKSCNRDACSSHLIILPTIYQISGQNKQSFSIPLTRVIVVGNLHLILPSRQIFLNYTPQLTRIRQSWCPHPHHKMLIIRFYPLCCGTILLQLILLLQAVIPLHNSLLINGNLSFVWMVESEAVVEESIGDCSARWSDLILVQEGSIPALLLLQLSVGQIGWWAVQVSCFKVQGGPSQLLLTPGLQVPLKLLVVIAHLIHHIDRCF